MPGVAGAFGVDDRPEALGHGDAEPGRAVDVEIAPLLSGRDVVLEQELLHEAQEARRRLEAPRVRVAQLRAVLMNVAAQLAAVRLGPERLATNAVRRVHFLELLLHAVVDLISGARRDVRVEV